MRLTPVTMVLALALAVGCDDDHDYQPLDAGTDGRGGMDAADAFMGGTSMAADGMPADAMPFVAITPCLTPESYVVGATAVATHTTGYVPPCLRVPVGTVVTFEASSEHPLEPRPLGSTVNPIPQRYTTTPVTFGKPGFFPFQCPEHVDSGMLGVVWVQD